MFQILPSLKPSLRRNASSFATSAEAEAYAQGTSSKPMSMYGPEQWAMCFPHLFPYGDGVFGLPRATPLTFQQCVGMHLLREELCFLTNTGDAAAARAWALQRRGRHAAAPSESI